MKINNILKKICSGIDRGYFAITSKIGGLSGYDMLAFHMKNLCHFYEENSNYYLSYRIRAKTSENIHCMDETNANDEKIAIVMQGPIFLKDHFTLETVKMYAKLFPSAKVVISTWKDQDKDEIERLRIQANCTVVINEKPEAPGILNGNYQCVSAYGGLAAAKELGCTYAVKTRGDIRIYEKGSLRYMQHMLEQFPCNETLFKQKKRLIVFDIATAETSILFYPFWITDMFMFGDIDDMMEYWHGDRTKIDYMDKVEVDRLIRTEHYSWKRRVEEGLHNESRIAVNYIERKLGKKIDISVKNYWNILKDYFIVISKSTIDCFFYKYDDWRMDEAWDYGTCFKNDSDENLLTYNFNFVSWLNLYHGDLEYKEEYENMCRERTYEYWRGDRRLLKK